MKTLFITLLLLASLSAMQIDKNRQPDPLPTCINTIIDVDFANIPFGKFEFSKSDLVDGLFKNLSRDECTMVRKGEIDQHYILFYEGAKNRYLFTKKQDEDIYCLYNATITSSDFSVKLSKSGKIIYINSSKEYIADIFNVRGTLCDTVYIRGEDSSDEHCLYFKNNLLHKIRLYTSSL